MCLATGIPALPPHSPSRPPPAHLLLRRRIPSPTPPSGRHRRRRSRPNRRHLRRPSWRATLYCFCRYPDDLKRPPQRFLKPWPLKHRPLITEPATTEPAFADLWRYRARLLEEQSSTPDCLQAAGALCASCRCALPRRALTRAARPAQAPR